jgi:predicted CXXCH cytochrome family protein
VHNRLLEAGVKHAHMPILGLLVVLACGLHLTAEEHPVPLPKDADCASCHEDKTKGKAVHSAIAMGCTTCHEVKTDGQATTVSLTAPKEQLCFSCHEKSKEENLHGPYDKGQCVTCHDPHTSDYPRQLRAEGNGLCMACHAEQAGLEGNVSLFGTQTMDKASFDQIPKIVPNPGVKAGHPFAKHPIADITDPVRGGKISCLSCHEPHAGPYEKLIVKAKTNDGDICAACHEPYEAKVEQESQKKYGAIEEKNRKDAEERFKKQNNERPPTPQKMGSNQP